jgi:hypothetical protein
MCGNVPTGGVAHDPMSVRNCNGDLYVYRRYSRNDSDHRSHYLFCAPRVKPLRAAWQSGDAQNSETTQHSTARNRPSLRGSTLPPVNDCHFFDISPAYPRNAARHIANSRQGVKPFISFGVLAHRLRNQRTPLSTGSDTTRSDRRNHRIL